ncbi:hypothetical protein IWQ62_000651 [Dispira parvispora]|uniref:Uncharacterized protein n=1 Tax=Dispira parvispora TaxID=1520584 RepID=A0A9W8AXX6_9FUNG|nr:hypothetical protein IWQ62_000651 [Dispira parvispora]
MTYQPRATRTRTPKQVKRYEDPSAQELVQGGGETSKSRKGTKGQVDIPQGHGVSLRSIPAFEKFIAKKDTSPDLLHSLHRILYGRPGAKNKFKQNLRAFCGFAQDALAEIDPAEWYNTAEEPTEPAQAVLASPEYQTLHTKLEKWTISNLSNLMHAFDLSSANTKESRVSILARFLMKPTVITKGGKSKTSRKKSTVAPTPHQPRNKPTTTPSRKRKLDEASSKDIVESEAPQKAPHQVPSPKVSSPEKPAVTENERMTPSPAVEPSHVEEKVERREEPHTPPTENVIEREPVTVEELSRGDTVGETLTYHGMDESPFTPTAAEATATEILPSPVVESPSSTTKEREPSPPSKRVKVNEEASEAGEVTDTLAEPTESFDIQEMDVDVVTGGDTVPQEPIVPSSMEYTETRPEGTVTEATTLPSFEEKTESMADESAIPTFTQPEETYLQETTTEDVSPPPFEQPTETYKEESVSTMGTFTPEPVPIKAYNSPPVKDSAPSSQPAKSSTTSSVGVNESIITTPSVSSSVAEKRGSEGLTNILATYSSTSSSNVTDDHSHTPRTNPLSVPFGLPARPKEETTVGFEFTPRYNPSFSRQPLPVESPTPADGTSTHYTSDDEASAAQSTPQHNYGGLFGSQNNRPSSGDKSQFTGSRLPGFESPLRDSSDHGSPRIY